MQFKFTEEQTLIRDTVESACAEACDERRLFHVISDENGFDLPAWKTLTQDLGMSGVAISEQYGGAGLGVLELASVFEKMGRVLLPTPFLTSIALCATSLERGDNEAIKSRILSELASGDKIASFVHLAHNGSPSLQQDSLKLSKTGQLNGSASCVQYGDVADYFLVLCSTESGEAVIVAVEAKTDGIHVERKTCMDLTRPVADVTFQNTPIFGEVLRGREQIKHCLNVGRICLASEQLGASEAVLEKTQQYVLERRQFGRQIGSFQAVKHRMADMMVLNEAAKSAAWYAACAADETPDDLAQAAATAMVVTSRALSRNAANMIQLHGGMGFTWECVAHLYFKRAAFSTRLLGPIEDHRETLAAIALGEVA